MALNTYEKDDFECLSSNWISDETRMREWLKLTWRIWMPQTN